MISIFADAFRTAARQSPWDEDRPVRRPAADRTAVDLGRSRRRAEHDAGDTGAAAQD